MNNGDLAIEIERISYAGSTLSSTSPRKPSASSHDQVKYCLLFGDLLMGSSSSDNQLAHLLKRIGSSNQDFQYKLARVLFEFCFFQMTTRHPSRQRLQRPLIAMQRGYIEVIRCPSAAAVPCGPASVQSYETRHMMQTHPRRRFRRSGA